MQNPPPLTAGAVLSALRPKHWLKNAFVLAPLIFAGKFTSAYAWGQCLIAVAAFCLLSSSVYLFNDILDRDLDRKHKDKCRRPIASGQLHVGGAIVLSLFLALMGLAVATLPGGPAQPAWARATLIVSAVAYLVLNVLYSTWLKSHSIIDVIAIALGFVLRATAGAGAIAVAISPWLVICTFMLCFFLAVSKRRVEYLVYADELDSPSRPSLKRYSIEELDRLLMVSATMAIMTYSLYCLAPRTVSHIGSGHMIWTIPVALYGVLRYDRVSRRLLKGDIVDVLLADRVMWLVLAIFVILAGLVVLFGRTPGVAEILDIGRA
ncbi:MAG: UbiA prenyltransferase family protein [Planctomycetaceae bacterium]|nr:UbiA prenyltransferase family protein [Planctomycetaceae bacterium]